MRTHYPNSEYKDKHPCRHVFICFPMLRYVFVHFLLSPRSFAALEPFASLWTGLPSSTCCNGFALCACVYHMPYGINGFKDPTVQACMGPRIQASNNDIPCGIPFVTPGFPCATACGPNSCSIFGCCVVLKLLLKEPLDESQIDAPAKLLFEHTLHSEKYIDASPEILLEILPEIQPEILPEVLPEILPDILPDVQHEILPQICLNCCPLCCSNRCPNLYIYFPPDIKLVWGGADGYACRFTASTSGNAFVSQIN